MLRGATSITDFIKFKYIKKYSFYFKGYPARYYVLSNNLICNVEVTPYGNTVSLESDELRVGHEDHLLRPLEEYLIQNPHKLVKFIRVPDKYIILE